MRPAVLTILALLLLAAPAQARPFLSKPLALHAIEHAAQAEAAELGAEGLSYGPCRRLARNVIRCRVTAASGPLMTEAGEPLPLVTDFTATLGRHGVHAQALTVGEERTV